MDSSQSSRVGNGPWRLTADPDGTFCVEVWETVDSGTGQVKCRRFRYARPVGSPLSPSTALAVTAVRGTLADVWRRLVLTNETDDMPRLISALRVVAQAHPETAHLIVQHLTGDDETKVDRSAQL